MSQSYIKELYENGKKAYWAIADFSQDQIDAMLEKMAKTVYLHAEELGRMVHEETALGDVNAKIRQMKIFPLTFWSYLKGRDAFGLLSTDQETKIETYGKAMGVIAVLTPSTTNIANGFEICMKSVKSGNAAILSPHPRAWKSSKRLTELLCAAIKEAGGPDHLIQSVENPTIELSGELMATCDAVVGTGGADMVKAAYSSGTPAFGVGQGNVPVVISKDYPVEELDMVTDTIITDRANDFGMPCNSPQVVLIPRAMEEKIMPLFVKNGGYIVEDEAVIDNIRKVVFPEGGHRINRDIVGRPAIKIAESYGIGVPENTRAILVRLKDGTRGAEDVLDQEIMNPTLRFQFYDDFNDAVEIARSNLFHEGAGHTAIIWSNNQNEIDRYAKRVPVVRCLVNQGSGGTPNLTRRNGLPPSTSVGGGTWGGNSFSDNLNYTTLQNHTMVVYPVYEGGIPTYEEVFGESPVTV